MASATAFARRYQNDLFLRTEVNIILLQVVYAAIILFLAIAVIVIFYQEITSGVTAAITATLNATSTQRTSDLILNQLEATRSREVAAVGVLIFSATALFGYLVARLALKPTRGALAAQKQFIGNVAHELRTPLAIIKANNEVLLLEGKIDTSARATLVSNVEELDRISEIINNLLSLNALVQPEQTSFISVDTGVIVRRVVDKLSRLARKNTIRIRVRIAAGASVWGNATAIEQIVTNILKNAIQHTVNGEIIITVGFDVNGALEISIRDTGMGIRREDLFRIFEPFYRGDRSRTRAGGTGSGLGLAIVSELVKLHQGRVAVKSAPGRGTTVTVTLPRGQRVSRKTIPNDDLDEVFADFSNGRATSC